MLSHIKTEETFRSIEEDLGLSNSIDRNGLEEILIVEGPTAENDYILVHGYRRFFALKNMGRMFVKCEVRPITSPRTRLLKRLIPEFQQKRRPVFEKEKMIKELIYIHGFSDSEIIMVTGMSPSTLKSYKQLIDIPEELKERLNSVKVGTKGLRKIYYLVGVSEKTRKKLLERYFYKEISEKHVDAIKKVVQSSHFKLLRISLQEKCINDAIKKAKFTTEEAKEIVYLETIEQYLEDKNINDFCHEHFVKHLQFLDRKLTRMFLKKLDDAQRNEYFYYLLRLLNKLSPTGPLSPEKVIMGSVHH